MSESSDVEKSRTMLRCALVLLLLSINGCSYDDGTALVGDAAAPHVRLDLSKPYQVEITGRENQWHVKYPNGEGRLAMGKSVTAARSIRVPLNADVIFVLKSDDYLYNVSVPELGLREVAVPDLEFRLKFRTTESGRYELIGEELCGGPHLRMTAHVLVQTEERLSSWLFN